MMIHVRTSVFAAIVLVGIASGCKKEDATQQQPPPTQQLPPLTAKTPPIFDAATAMKEVETQVKFGPRVPNSHAHDEEVAYLKEQLSAYTAAVNVQSFTDVGYDGKPLELSNLVASFNPSATDRIVILTHFDSRPWADQDADSTKHHQPVPAANDGASGTAVMLELARMMYDDPPPIGVDLLFDDGEDYGKPEVDNLNKYFLGAKYFVKTMPQSYHPRFAILLDMVGDKHAVFAPEGNSLHSAGAYTREIWSAAKLLGLTTFQQSNGGTIEDDHLPFLEAGIPAVDIIDADLVGAHTTDPNRKYWHTTHDLPNNLSETTLGEVGRLLLYLIYERLPSTIRSLS